ncbi:GNAT family N-acetyltransferase [Rhodopirellula bahusiensis]|uniref:GNAT family N-acetyltransferase n=1 Tax=Rhodopirellula bahusiensis TaxID=2014065 RepID=A0A2G1W5A9_9BACT|nr:GNAT family N-acetyltransferase [Rhodopirellula bahusiensis]PHQ33829.1 GNAT family N-acetyltransferase [Rhodopirellula bahusiensis]
MKLRPFRSDDAIDCWRMFRDTVHRVNARDYSQEQLNAWAPESIDLDHWAQRFDGHVAVVVESDSRIIGFADMSHAGHLDRLFVSADHQRRGVAKLIWRELVEHAVRLECQTVCTEASITAKPFFESVGFVVIARQEVECRGVTLTNYRMEWRRGGLVESV